MSVSLLTFQSLCCFCFIFLFSLLITLLYKFVFHCKELCLCLKLEDDHRQDSYSRRVLRAIQRVGSTRWYALGRDCGQTNDQLREFTFLVNDCDKVQALFDVMAQKVGGKRAADKLLDACQTMQNPIFAEVEEVMDKM